MKKIFFTTLLGLLFTINISGQANLSFAHKGITYACDELPVMNEEYLPEDYIIYKVINNEGELVLAEVPYAYDIFKATNDDDVIVVEIDGKLYIIFYS
jgi:hypothetical protein